MTTEALKSTQVTNLDSSPATPNTPSVGGPSVLRTADGNVTATTAVTSGSTYQILRLPARARLKHLYMKLDATVTTFTGDIGFYYSTSATDGTSAANQGTKVNGNTGSQLLGAAVALASQVTFLDLVSNVNLAAAKLDKALWDACGLATDPGPNTFFDLVITTTATNSGGPTVYAEAQYTE